MDAQRVTEALARQLLAIREQADAALATLQMLSPELFEGGADGKKADPIEDREVFGRATRRIKRNDPAGR